MLNFRQFGQLLVVIAMVCVAMFVGFGIARLLDRSRNVAQVTELTPQSAVIPPDQRRRSVLGSSDSDGNLPSPPPITPTASAAPDVALILPPTPTSQPDQQVGDRFVDERFGSTATGWIDRADDTWSAQYVDGGYRLALNGQPSMNIAWPAPATDFRLSVDLTIAQGQAGIVFLAQKPATFYRIVLSDDGQYAIQVQQGEELRTVASWTTSEAIPRSPGTPLQLRVERVDRRVEFWVNNQSLRAWTIPPGEFVSHYGVAVASPEQQAEATFDNLVGETLQSPPSAAGG